ncbi:DNA-directed RNA polymerase subunit omega [Kytococcus aerolatus]|uniref:DNA-directed RNA polymerase subunit omega n=1 Tax=Kytococcus aerolatus TaxID=592308 RepID=A0A212T096_9MICO|nr:DNA-directed RNA polymerase subunit omega [Kytococcus aerolatus]SNC59300.1 DNA-directed RNA polymerase subunit omega [Kytococcus aerolatus]
MSGTKAAPIGVTNPPIDDLLKHVDSKYALVIYSAKRARQINAYYSQQGEEGLLEYVGPLVEAEGSDKPLSVALREINEDKLVRTVLGEVEEADDLPAIEAVEEDEDVVLPAENVDVSVDAPDAAPVEAPADEAATDEAPEA